MVLPFEIGGARVVVPGVYDTLTVQSSLPAPVPAGRSLLILGESEEGIPGKDLDLRLNFFTDFASVRDFYKAGPIVDAARSAFTAQPNPVFGGSILRLYVWKTNATTRASKTIAPAGYGTMFAGKYGEDGNMIKSQIKALSETKPTKTFTFLPSAAPHTLEVAVNGVVTQVPVLPVDITTGAGCPAQVSSMLNAITGLSCPSVPMKQAVAAGPIAVTLSALGDNLTITGTLLSVIVAGDVVVIPEGSALAGLANENAGVYKVVSWSATGATIKQIKRWDAGVEVSVTAFDTTAASITPADIAGFGSISVTVTATTARGAASTLEIANSAGAVGVVGCLVDYSLTDIVRTADIGVGTVAVSTSGANLTVTLSNAQFTVKPSVGDLVVINTTSTIAGLGNANVGLWVVQSASWQSVTLVSAYGLNPLSVSAPALTAGMVKWAPSVISTALAAKKIESTSEPQVWIEAIDTKNNVSYPTTKVGGSTFLEVGFNDGVATACTLSIDATRTLTITPAGGSAIVVKLSKYKTLQNLADFLNTKTGVYARVPNNLNKTLPTSVLDAVDTVGCMGAFSPNSSVGKIKGDYYSFKKLMDDNFGLLAFGAGNLVLKAGLPDAESAASYLSGAVVGGTTDADVQAGLDQSLKIDVRCVIPLFSRDALDDINDGTTDTASSYTIDSINAAVKNSVATASTIKVRRYRFGMLSIHESFENAKVKCSEIAYERCQMTFEMVRAIDGNGAINWFLPWMGAVIAATGRAQAPLGTSLLRKTFSISDVKHIGKKSLYSDTLVQDFDPEDVGQVESAISTGLMVFRAVTGFGIRLESPDLSTRSRENDPEGWVWERVNVLFTLDEVRTTVDGVLDNYIGDRQSDTSPAVVTEAINKSFRPFISSGSLQAAVVDSVTKEGVGYRAKVRVLPVECVEFIGMEMLAERAV